MTPLTDLVALTAVALVLYVTVVELENVVLPLLMAAFDSFLNVSYIVPLLICFICVMKVLVLLSMVSICLIEDSMCAIFSSCSN